MDRDEPQILDFRHIEKGKEVQIVNRTNGAKKYTFKNGKYGEVSFTLIVGAKCSFIVGDVIPVIEMHDADEEINIDLSPSAIQ